MKSQLLSFPPCQKSVGLHGGERYDADSMKMANIIRTVLQEQEFAGKLRIEFNELGEKPRTETILGIGQRKDYSVKIITEAYFDDF